jgi:quinohemoprotein ethanol dehydrogenase
MYCWMCHSGPVNPDLRRSGALPSADAWRSILIDGALEPAGMASFRDYLTPEQAEAIRAHISSLSQKLKAAEDKGEAPPSMR